MIVYSKAGRIACSMQEEDCPIVASAGPAAARIRSCTGHATLAADRWPCGLATVPRALTARVMHASSDAFRLDDDKKVGFGVTDRGRLPTEIQSGFGRG